MCRCTLCWEGKGWSEVSFVGEKGNFQTAPADGSGEERKVVFNSDEGKKKGRQIIGRALCAEAGGGERGAGDVAKLGGIKKRRRSSSTAPSEGGRKESLLQRS